MKIKYVWFLLLSVLALQGCSIVAFDRFPGDKLEKIPQELQGKYFAVNPKNDTAICHIREDGWMFFEKADTEATTLSDSMVCSRYGNYFFFSARDDKTGYWMCGLLEPVEEGFWVAIISPPDKKDDKKDLAFLKKYFGEVKQEGNDYYIQMNEENLIRYYKKVYRKKKGEGQVKFIRASVNP